MKTLIINRIKDYAINRHSLRVYVDGEFLDYIEPNEKSKKIKANLKASELKIMFDKKRGSNSMKIGDENELSFNVTSQYINFLYVFCTICFFIAMLWILLYPFVDFLPPTLYAGPLVLAYFYLPIIYLFRRKDFLRLSRKSL